MNAFVNRVNSCWKNTSPVTLAALVLFYIGYIHPFVDGNGRTQRATAYWTLCLKMGMWLPGNPRLPELLEANRDEYITTLKQAQAAYRSGVLNLEATKQVISALLRQQVGASIPRIKVC